MAPLLRAVRPVLLTHLRFATAQTDVRSGRSVLGKAPRGPGGTLRGFGEGAYEGPDEVGGGGAVYAVGPLVTYLVEAVVLYADVLSAAVVDDVAGGGDGGGGESR